MNIILVVFDSLRKDCIGSYGQPFWGKVHTPRLDELAEESLIMTRAYPESLPTLPTRRALYTGRRVYPFHDADFVLKGDFHGAPGWGPIPEDQPTLAEMLRENGYRTALFSDVYHQFKPSKNFWRGFSQWMFLRGQESDPYRSGPVPSEAEIDRWMGWGRDHRQRVAFLRQCLMNMHDRTVEEDYFCAQVIQESVKWLQQNQDAEKFFLVVESFDPHEPWFVPEHYRRMYDSGNSAEQVVSWYNDVSSMPSDLLYRTQANYSGLVTMCDRWFGHLHDAMRALGLLENTLLVVTTDHGHSIGDKGYMGKRGYPSAKEVYDIPIFIRHPQGIGAGKLSDLLVQHTDVSALILEHADVQPEKPLDGKSFWNSAVSGGSPIRDHVTVGWGAGLTVIDQQWWLSCKLDSTGAFLYDLDNDPNMEVNVADRNPDQMRRLYHLALEDAVGGYPAYLLEMCVNQTDAPGCSAIAARE